MHTVCAFEWQRLPAAQKGNIVSCGTTFQYDSPSRHGYGEIDKNHGVGPAEKKNAQVCLDKNKPEEIRTKNCTLLLCQLRRGAGNTDLDALLQHGTWFRVKA